MMALIGSSRVLRVLVVALMVSGLAALLQAQVDTGSITGTITDPSGAVVSGAKVTLVNQGTTAALTTTTTSDGVYEFAPVRVGPYKLDAPSQGFQAMTQTGDVLTLRSNVPLSFSLKPGRHTQTVEVTS